MKGFKWAEGRSPLIAQDKSKKITKLVYDFCISMGICVTCKRRWAVPARRMCARCTNHNRDYQRRRREESNHDF